MATLRAERLQVRSPHEIVMVRQKVRAWAIELGFSLIDQTKLITAASELARNTATHGGGGTVLVERLNHANSQGLRLTFEDQGPGIADVELALKEGFSTTGGLGLGLSGSRRLVNEFSISSRLGEGTRVSITKWT